MSKGKQAQATASPYTGLFEMNRGWYTVRLLWVTDAGWRAIVAVARPTGGLCPYCYALVRVAAGLKGARAR